MISHSTENPSKKVSARMIGKLHRRIDPNGRVQSVFALCDRELLGNIYKEGDVVLDLKTYRYFYEGMPVSREDAVVWLKKTRNINLVGEKALACAKKALPLDEKSVLRIAGVPHLQIYYV